jgi:hypothetical protein
LTHNILSIDKLKGWLRFNPITWSFYGVPPVDAAGTYTISLKVNDPFTGFVNDPFDLKINSRPIVHPVNGRVPAEFSMQQGTLNIKVSDYFDDADISAGDTLTYSIRQANGLTVSNWV